MRGCLRIAVPILSFSCWGQAVSPASALAEADRLADLRAWTRAEPFFIQAEKEFEQAGDARNALHAKLGRIRGELPRRSVAEVSKQLAEILESPLATTDDQIRLRCLIIKGETDEDHDALLAETDWREALAIAKKLNDAKWINRANGELGIVAGLQGKTGEAMLMIGTAVQNAKSTNDLSSVVRFLSVLGNGLIQFGRPEQALTFFNQAIAAGSSVDELRFSAMANLGKVSALVKLNRTKEARDLLAVSLEVPESGKVSAISPNYCGRIRIWMKRPVCEARQSKSFWRPSISPAAPRPTGSSRRSISTSAVSNSRSAGRVTQRIRLAPEWRRHERCKRDLCPPDFSPNSRRANWRRVGS
jgi:tetratricopeptide (TPR) repeat protein